MRLAFLNWTWRGCSLVRIRDVTQKVSPEKSPFPLEKTFLNEVGGKEASGDETVVEFICLERTLWVDLSDHFQNRGKRPRRWNDLSWVTHVWKLTPVTLHRDLERNTDHELSVKCLPGAFYSVSVSLGTGSHSISDGAMRWPNSLFFFLNWDPW